LNAALTRSPFRAGATAFWPAAIRTGTIIFRTAFGADLTGGLRVFCVRAVDFRICVQRLKAVYNLAAPQLSGEGTEKKKKRSGEEWKQEGIAKGVEQGREERVESGQKRTRAHSKAKLASAILRRM
jgi:hypothetical protein